MPSYQDDTPVDGDLDNAHEGFKVTQIRDAR